jgi:alkylhydroperoxidase family enzyme
MTASFIQERSGYDAAAIAAHEAEINGKPQRVESVRLEEVSQDARDLINGIRATIGLAPTDLIPGYSLLMIKHPELFRRQLEMGIAFFKGRVAPRERELAVLRTAWLLRAPFEWGEHVDIGKRYGVTAEEIERVIQGSAAPGWSEHEAAILRAVEEMLSEQVISDETWATLAKSWDDQQLIEFPLMVGQYVATALQQNALRVRLAPDNPGLTYR